MIVSLLTIVKGAFIGKRSLDGKPVDFITTYLDDTEPLGNPYRLKQNEDKSFVGSYVLGKGFILKPEEALSLIEKNPKNKDVLFPYLNGADLNTHPDQSPSRWVINFFDWPIEKAQEYPECFRIIEEKVKPERTRLDEKGKFKLRKPLPQKWWIYADKRPKLYKTIKTLDKVLVIARVSKYVSFAFLSSDYVFMDKIFVFTYIDFYFFSILQSSLHNEWAWRFSSTLGSSTLNYSPTDCFVNFPFPYNLHSFQMNFLNKIGAQYHEHRRQFMLKMNLGLTKTYNLFHRKDLTVAHILKESKQPQETCEETHQDIITLRQLHKQMDETALKAYGWLDIDLGHDFNEMDYLPENDRVRYTIAPEARKEILKRLLKLNHEIHEQEVNKGLHEKRKTKKKSNTKQMTLFE